jgi:hypothetical protein
LYVNGATDGEHILLNPINASSNVGIGTTSPGAKLEVIATTGSAVHAEGDTFGIRASGNRAGGYFEDASGFPAYAYLGMDSRGIRAVGMTSGGLFEDYDASGYATVGSGDYGIQAYGNTMGGRFVDLNSSGLTYIAYGDRGIEAYGDVGGYFEGLSDSTTSTLCSGRIGVQGIGPYAGGVFWDFDGGGYCQVAYSSYKTYGSGTPSFVQNHPYDKEKVVVYAAPEGDEAATYTRGTARLIDGEARVLLGETFKWVTNPDIGLTAHLTPRRQAVPLAVVSLTTEELVVRGPEDGPADLVFDYIVYGLRIGFEEISIVQEKIRESYIPSMADHRDLYDRHPELRKYNSLERFTSMSTQIGTTEPLDLTASRALRDAIVEFNPVIHGATIPERLEQEEAEILDEERRSATEKMTRERQ